MFRVHVAKALKRGIDLSQLGPGNSEQNAAAAKATDADYAIPVLMWDQDQVKPPKRRFVR
jgi:hypothetical protein